MERAQGVRRWLLSPGGADFEARFTRAIPSMNEFGVDPFGYSVGFSLWVVGPLLWLYRHYFRVECHGIDRLPKGRLILVANHSGQIPLDAGMIAIATLLDAPRPRAVRGMAERWIPTLPFASTFMARTGMVVGTPENCRRLLKAEEAVLVFPEGIQGIVKVWSRRYQLQPFGQGFMRLALETGSPIVPVAVIGAEEQLPALWESRWLGRLLGIPSIPIVACPVPLPSKYHLYFGEPLWFDAGASDEDSEIERRVDRVKTELQAMIQAGLRTRRGIFR